MAKKENVSYEKALRKIEKEVIVWKQRLNTQHLTFEGIGEMRLNPNKRITFSPFGGLILTLIPMDSEVLLENLYLLHLS